MIGSWSRRRALLAGGAFAAAGLAARGATAQLRVDITQGNVDPIPIAVSPFAGDGPRGTELGQAVAEVVAADLDGSGLFRTLDRRAYIQSPDELRNVPRFADWRQINAQALVTGVVGPGPQGIGIEFRLWDVFGGSQLRGLRFDTAESQWRRIAHKIADVIYERMTGEKGYFDTRIAYVAESGPAQRRIKRIAIMDQDGANHRFLTDGSTLVLTPRFSPDGARVAYLEFRGIRPRVYIRDVDGSRVVPVATDLEGMTFSPRFSPDGGSMLLTVASGGNSDIYSVGLAGGGARRLTNSPAIDTSPTYSPDGARICFNSDRGGTPQLYLMDRNGGGVQRVSYGDGRYGSPAWSPRGDFIAFTSIKRGAFHIGVMRPDGRDERLITRSFLDQGPSWAPNGRLLLFARKERGSASRLVTIDVTGYNERRLQTPLDASDPDWSPLIP
ncbi:MAG TPA: Tol-Pal system beta propeller repeat protein TolB [Geminicoccaceae bacterium]|nr:Tol-Pal system beta propeller repeat protein TolB [Geminicoccus sp.]HMU50380.1 Tol-Pal system beta propeller repeat protein TolB [Geminicoccaceae bacterium]